MENVRFLLAELLVAIAIIGMLVEGLIPAVQQTQEAARQLPYDNPQLALAAMNVESSHPVFPKVRWGYSWLGDSDAEVGQKQSGSWYFPYLPWMEQKALYQLPADGVIPENSQP